MAWRLIPKNKNSQPKTGEYSDWKQQIADECFNQCVYCSIHEQQFGGIDHYHIDHYRPKSRKEFEALRNDILNLFYACPICNRFKREDWPGEPTDLNNICYPDPSATDYSTLFELNNSLYVITGRYRASTYVIERLYLNRPQLIYERRESTLKDKEARLTAEITDLSEGIDDADTLKSALKLVNAVRQHISKREKIAPYLLSEVRKERK
jgi:hypothetical protein